MNDYSASSHLKVLFEAALQDYEAQTGIALPKHPLAERLQECHSIESITTVLQEQTQAFNEFRGKDKVIKSLKNAVSVLYKLSAYAKLGEVIGVKFSPPEAIHSGLAVLLSAIEGIKDSYDALVELLESTEHVLYRLDIYTKITPTPAMTEILVKILVELLSTLALATKQVKQGKPKKFVKKLFGGEKDIEAVLERLNRLTQDEAKLTAAQILEVVHGLVQNMKVVTDDGKASLNCVRDALETMNQIASDMSKSKRDKLQKDIREWLSPPDPWKNHNIARELQHDGTAEWFVQGDTFKAWKVSDPSSLLWIHGKPGAGKSILCSSIIQDVIAMQKAGLASLAFFYCDFREDQKKDLRGLLSSLLVQLCHQSNSYCDTLFKFYTEHDEGKRDPSDKELARCLTDILKTPRHAPVYVIVDALDECPNTSAVRSPRAKVLDLIEELIKSQCPNLRVCVTSRPETDIKDILDTLIFRSVSLHDEGGQNGDIEDYIRSVIRNHTKNRRWRAEHKQLVIDVLTEKANGMFRWADCQLAYICGCIPARIQHALADLPSTLDETYERTLGGINEADWEFAHRLFQFAAVASRPLRVKELAELLAFDFKAGPVPKFHEDWRLEDPVDAVLSACSSLLAVVDVEGSPVIQFSHFSVKEYLTSPRLAETTDIIPRRFHISMKSAHTLASQACLGTLLHLDNDVITLDSLEDYPLAEYAAEHWADHSRFEDVSLNVMDGMKLLFDPSKPHLAVCLWIYDPEHFWVKGSKRDEKPSPAPGSSLHYAAFWGLYSIVHFLVVELSQDVHSRSAASHNLAGDETPLHVASNKEIACLLVEHGADVSARDGYGQTPLHMATYRCYLEVARILIEHGADVSAQDDNGNSPLHLALLQGDVEAAKMLIECGADVSPHDQYEKTSLHWASEKGYVEIAQMLIDRGADVTAQDRDGYSPLYLALFQGNVEVAQILIDHKDFSPKDECGWNYPLHLASGQGHVEPVQMLIERRVDLLSQDLLGRSPLIWASEAGHVGVAQMLIECGADVLTQDKDGNSPLYWALRGGHVKVAQMLIECGADVSAQNKDGTAPLHQVSQAGHVEVAQLLIERGADVSAQDKNGETSLHQASVKGVAQLLIEHGADISAQDKDGNSPLHRASGRGRVEVAQMLIEHGANVSAQNKYGFSPSHRASEGNCVEVTQMLIEHGADISAQDKYGLSPLHRALYVQHVEVAQMLIKHGADISAQDKDGNTPLLLASVEGVAQMLIERGADVSAQDKDGNSLLHRASRWGHVKVSQILIERGANVSAQNKYGISPLYQASEAGRVEVAQMLIDHGADISAQDKDGNPPLHRALRMGFTGMGCVQVAQMLIEHGADISAQDKNGQTSLHWASQQGYVEVVQMLLDRGADASAKDNDGLTPLDRASRRGFVNVVQMLILHGASRGAN